VQVDSLLEYVERLGTLKSQKVAAAARRLETQSERRVLILLGLIALAVVVGIVVVALTIRSIGAPLDALVAHARRLSEGDLTVRTHSKLPGEFQILGSAMNQTGDSLSKVVSVAAKTAENVASSAHQLSSVSEQISQSASEMADAMTEVSRGAEQQVQQLRSIEDALQAIQRAADSVTGRSSEVHSLAGEIQGTASDKRREIERALAILGEVKTSVERAAAEVIALNTTTADINRFVKTVGSIAEQTNLLALNAAIEAARAGESGKGFAVVADEVRKLAEQTQRAADDIVQMTSVVTSRVASSSRVMETGAARVVEIERVSREIDQALHVISKAAERARSAADQVTVAAAANAAAVTTATTGLESIARTAENHAAAAEEVSASTQEQSAACEEMTSASTLLLQGSTQLKELVGGLKT
jgi:methyl-accepting chemotaxis protein